jgi:hypothetical protein
MIVMAVCSVLSFLGILSFTVGAMISSLINGLIYGYLYVVLYSLFEMFRSENERGFTAQYQQPVQISGGKV